ncbi:NAD-dependent deacetylase [Gracilibacillus halophilus YIM-C55.5]|uniref:protein acetyllysine N-acetyltransferase n=1 Tax=Gracilibacillus halophilus YIM-C55.5 TaxID=1308866 RepID=N4W7F8_9BACI|nr:NAD-dependent protein deacylase [Gracilibacillus halophilus]ENH96198.1 NAD-dependent deacetylase [Gracilibacillus halophilus YIM-C55.5]
MGDQKTVWKQMIEQAQTITVLTGAGVSTASGIPDFRSSQGVWTYDHSREYYMSRHYFHQDPEDFWKKYKDIFQIKLLQQYEPNDVHQFIKSLEDDGKEVTVVTQNVDGLHQQAGSQHVIEYHGNLATSSCPSCGTQYDLEYVMNHDVPYCSESGCGDILKPDIVLFGDPITKHTEAEQAVAESDLLIVMGTSLQVMPFSLLVENRSVPKVMINKEPTEKDDVFDDVIHDDLVRVVRDVMNGSSG